MTQDEIKKAQELSRSVSALGKSSNPTPQKKETYVIPSPKPEIKQDTPKEIADKLNTLKDAIDASVIKGLLKPSDVVEEIKNLKGNDRIDISHIRNGEQIARYFNKANDGFNMNDQRWHGAGSSGGGTPGGSNTQVQFNNSGSFGGSANFTWDNTNSAIGLFGSYIIGDGTDVYISGTPTPFVGAHPYIQFDANENFVDEAQIFGSDSAGNFFDITANNGNPSVEVYSIVNGKHVFLSPFRDCQIDTAGTFSLKTGAGTYVAFIDASGISSSDKTFVIPNQAGVFSTVTSGVLPPSSTPAAVGMIFVNTASAKVYISTGTASSANWSIMN